MSNAEKMIGAMIDALPLEEKHDIMERLGWVNIGYKYDLDKVQRALPVKYVPAMANMSIANAVYHLRTLYLYHRPANADESGMTPDTQTTTDGE